MLTRILNWVMVYELSLLAAKNFSLTFASKRDMICKSPFRQIYSIKGRGLWQEALASVGSLKTEQ